ncbi:histidinol-phosphatase HisJ [Periweissella fabaria]|uniref:Histidinol-phosphatase n=1 Tax=Periweissella fabaria TaxID=546157 RepID=A0ABN8BGC4_9LACO|nr:histidinol-phosphatase HisJ [Periweissella fabaria]MCM0597585.1 histidinol-phosphatase HisJ [Periweissella fabaria]CAH0416770.1 Histidinol-phosphatase [Periweissella fabaria]
MDLERLLQIDRRTWNGHTHTEFCPHGSGEDVELFIQRAIDAGFKTYTITEHFPMAPEFYTHVTGAEHAITTACMAPEDLPTYFEKLATLKAKYADQITLLTGFEFDYLKIGREYTATALAQYADQIDDAILSVHFLPTKMGLRAVDDSCADFKAGVLAEYKTPLGVAKAYLKTIKEALEWQVANKPGRIGHITLYRKWRNEFPNETIWCDAETDALITAILRLVKEQGIMLDCNMSGIPRETQTESSPTFDIIRDALMLGIPMVYGSDAHAVVAVNQGYNVYLDQKMYL